MPQLPVPRPAHVLKQQQKDGWKEEDEFAEVDVNGKELFVKSSKNEEVLYDYGDRSRLALEECPWLRQ